jgi:hypothetical protein
MLGEEVSLIFTKPFAKIVVILANFCWQIFAKSENKFLAKCENENFRINSAEEAVLKEILCINTLY